jgi:phage-related protein
LAWFAGLPQKIIDAIISLNVLAISWAAKVFSGLVDALPGLAIGAIEWFAGLPGRIVGAIPDASKILFNVGEKIIQGLLDGIKSGLGAVKDFLGGVASDIVSWKGPPAYDKTILIGNGRLVMRGFQTGLESGMNDVHRQLSGFTAGLPHAARPSPVRAGGSAAVTINVSIVNPSGNGREIAKEVVGALRNGHSTYELKQVLGI